ncbi:MAG TPA: hypothetical protein VL326_36530 [Kofleriaceae bacterium]|nr:hypothetical protein [Kofleriaceae bacterium]
MRGVLLSLIVAVAATSLAACSHSKAAGPAWPAPDKTEPEEDGGESIAPHESSTVAAAIEKSDEPEAKKDDEPDAAAPEAKKDDSTPAVSAPSQPSSDETIFSDEIIIEIDD